MLTDQLTGNYCRATMFRQTASGMRNCDNEILVKCEAGSFRKLVIKNFKLSERYVLISSYY